ncbi:MAG: phosphatase PAP2 family protein [Flavobacteriaceae bacterium]
MFEKIIALDKKAFVFLNSLGSETYDGFWLIITKQWTWIPFFLLLFYLLQQKIGWRNLGIALVYIGLLMFLCDQSANLFKVTFERLRPCNDPEIKDVIRIVKPSITYSFFSAHAANSMAAMVFAYSLLKRYYKFGLWVFVFPLVFAYSRIYLGVHFPGDILFGYLFGGFFGWLFFKHYSKKYFQAI